MLARGWRMFLVLRVNACFGLVVAHGVFIVYFLLPSCIWFIVHCFRRTALLWLRCCGERPKSVLFLWTKFLTDERQCVDIGTNLVWDRSFVIGMQYSAFVITFLPTDKKDLAASRWWLPLRFAFQSRHSRRTVSNSSKSNWHLARKKLQHTSMHSLFGTGLST